MRKKLVTLILALSVAVSVFAGCGNKADTSESSGEIKKEEAVKEETADSSSDSIFNETGYPVVNEPVTITAIHRANGDRIVEYEENTAFQYWQEVTGVDLEVTPINSDEWSEQFGLKLASGDLPDLILGESGLSDAELVKYVENGTFIDITPYLQYCENIQWYMDNFDGFKQASTLSNGAIVTLPQINMNVEGSGKCPQATFDIYQPWLDALGLKAPTSIDELYDVLVAFKTQDPNGNGIQDEIPFASHSVGYTYDLFSLWGVIVQENQYAYANGDKIEFSPFMPGFKAGLEFFAKMYEEDLMNKDLYTMTGADVLAMASGDVPIIGCATTSAAHSTVGEVYVEGMVAMDLFAADGYDLVWRNRTMNEGKRVLISSSCEHPEIALRVIDYLYSKEGGELVWMGTEDSYTFNDDGIWTWNLEEGMTQEEHRSRYTLQPLGGLPAAHTADWFTQDAGAESIVNAKRVQYAKNHADVLRTILPPLSLSGEEAEESALIAADLNGYVNTSIASFITGEMSIENDWDTFVETCKDLRVEEYIALYQAAYDRYLSAN